MNKVREDVKAPLLTKDQPKKEEPKKQEPKPGKPSAVPKEKQRKDGYYVKPDPKDPLVGTYYFNVAPLLQKEKLSVGDIYLYV